VKAEQSAEFSEKVATMAIAASPAIADIACEYGYPQAAA
jgi:hypothetical protein